MIRAPVLGALFVERFVGSIVGILFDKDDDKACDKVVSRGRHPYANFMKPA